MKNMTKVSLAVMVCCWSWSFGAEDQAGERGGAACCAVSDGKDFKLDLRYGICSKPSASGAMKKAGYDYQEAGVKWFLVPDKSDEEFLKLYLEALKDMELEIEACNGFLPGNLKVVGPAAKPEKVLEWAQTAFRRAKLVGIKIIVFGSGVSRRIPEGFGEDKAREQFVDLLKKMGPIAKRYGVTVVIEPLNKKETNFINSVSEAVDIAREAAHPNIRVLADFYHMLREKEGAESLLKAGKLLAHCHIAELEDRMAPGTHGEDFRSYFAALKQIGYRGRLSIEGRWKNFEQDLPKALQAMREQIAEVNQRD